ncbi:universal stress protein [Streptomyces sp. NPDC057438]|uniref:universal stress protein n=1 Tax=Streptomyces sp. NPDC057438 TaxID=3346133 RepID=UPI0036C3170D
MAVGGRCPMGVSWLRQVVAATDLSLYGSRAVGRAVRLGRLHGARVTSVCVVSPRLDTDLVEDVRTRLAGHARQYAGAERVEVVVRSGRVSPTLVLEVERRGADLLVVGAHGVDRLADALLGTTPENLVRASRAPVLVVRGSPDEDYRRVLLAVDTHEFSLAAARCGIALSPGAEHWAVHTCVAPGEHMLRMNGVSEQELTRLRQECLDEVRPRIERMVRALPLPAGVRPLVTSGDPARTIPDLAGLHEADLVVVGTGARSKLEHALLGSVAQHVMRRVLCDVLVVRGPGG